MFLIGGGTAFVEKLQFSQNASAAPTTLYRRMFNDTKGFTARQGMRVFHAPGHQSVVASAASNPDGDDGFQFSAFALNASTGDVLFAVRTFLR